MVDKNGNHLAEGELGLLLYSEEPVAAMPGTVCDDRFTQNSAVAICRLMGYVILSFQVPNEAIACCLNGYDRKVL